MYSLRKTSSVYSANDLSHWNKDFISAVQVGDYEGGECVDTVNGYAQDE